MTPLEPTDDACRIDVWLWRARLVKTRAQGAALAASGKIRLTHGGRQIRLEKAGRSIRPGDEILFAQGGRIISIRIEAIGERRGPAGEARALYSPLTTEA